MLLILLMMRRYTLLLALASSAVLFAACGDENDDTETPGTGGDVGTGGEGGESGNTGGDGSGATGGEGGSSPELQSITLNFRAQIGEELFACGEDYANQGSSDVEVTPQDFRFFVSKIRLINQAGDEVPFLVDDSSPWQSPEVALLDFEDGSGACKNGNADMNTKITGKVPAGEYQGIVLSTAVPVELNHADPTTLPAPLQAGGMSWNWLLGFKFIRAELLATSAPGVGDEQGAGVFHLGSTGCDNSNQGEGGAGGHAPDRGAAPSTACAKQNRNEISLDDFDPSEDVIVADIGALMADNDLSKKSACHSGGDTCDGYFNAAGVDFATGAALESQSMFRAEAK